MIINNEYYPTPETIAAKMVEKIDIRTLPYNISVLEPSAGDGNLINSLGSIGRSDRVKFKVDFVEIDESLQVLCEHRFSSEKKRSLSEKEREIRDKRWQLVRTGEIQEDDERYKRLEKEEIAIYKERNSLEKIEALFVGNDFLEFETHKRYDIILMNPPFSKGAEHLMKALKMQERNGGQVVALLNAETIKNPYSQLRKDLIKKLEENNASFEYIENGFIDADHKTDVEVVIINVKLEKAKSKSLIFEDLERADEYTCESGIENFLSVGGGNVQQLIEQFNYEVRATLKFLDEYNQLKPYILNSKKYEDDEERFLSPIIELKINGHTDGSESYNKVVVAIRSKYWRALFHNKEFSSRLTSDLSDTFYSQIEEFKNYDFNLFNIKRIIKQLEKAMSESYSETIEKIFDKLSVVHSYTGSPDCENVHFYNGWKTNKAWKINEKKVILPCYEVFRGWNNTFNAFKAQYYLSDIEKVLDYLDQGEHPAGSMLNSLNMHDNSDTVRNVSQKYFSVSFYKKGTCHIKWNPGTEKLIAKLNIFGSRKKGWLPPVYGMKAYEDMTDEEKAVIDEFQGREEYEKVLCEKDYYLVDDSNFLLLEA